MIPRRAPYIVEMDRVAVNRDRQLGALPPLGSLFLAKDLANGVAARSIWSVQRMGESFQHIGLVDVQFGGHFEGGAGCWSTSLCSDEGIANQAAIAEKKFLQLGKKVGHPADPRARGWWGGLGRDFGPSLILTTTHEHRLCASTATSLTRVMGTYRLGGRSDASRCGAARRDTVRLE